MKSIQVKPFLLSDIAINEVAEILDDVPAQAIENAPWNDSKDLPEVNFSIGYHAKGLGIKYRVKEDCFRLEFNQTNQPVYQDSCVEFFATLNENQYINFEFNAGGVCLAQSGAGRNNRLYLSSGEINSIQRFALIGVDQNREKPYQWSLTVFIPWNALQQDGVPDQLKANFYKCGDRLAKPHYLCWNPIDTQKPDFHRPEYFGYLKFEK